MVDEWTHGKVTKNTGDGNKYVGELEKFILYQNKAWFSVSSRGLLKISLVFLAIVVHYGLLNTTKFN